MSFKKYETARGWLVTTECYINLVVKSAEEEDHYLTFSKMFSPLLWFLRIWDVFSSHQDIVFLLQLEWYIFLSASSRFWNTCCISFLLDLCCCWVSWRKVMEEKDYFFYFSILTRKKSLRLTKGGLHCSFEKNMEGIKE